MNFSQDWFSHNIPNFQYMKALLPSCKRILEIGCFEGRATCWMLENLLDDDGKITCVDTFQGSVEHTNIDLSDLFNKWKDNVEWVRKEGQICSAYIGKSYKVLGHLIAEEEQYDFIYIDGSHTAPDVMADACMAFGTLKTGGIMLFDDYLWADMPGVLNRPKIAIDYFTTAYSDKIELVLLGYQLAIRKI